MARWLLSTDTLVDHVAGGAPAGVLSTGRLSDIAVSALSFEWILADAECDPDLSPGDRSRWRTNIGRFRDILIDAGGAVPAISTQVLGRWGQIMLLDLRHADEPGSEPREMPTEERLVVATAAAEGYVYVTPPRDWNEVIEHEGGISIEIV